MKDLCVGQFIKFDIDPRNNPPKYDKIGLIIDVMQLKEFKGVILETEFEGSRIRVGRFDYELQPASDEEAFLFRLELPERVEEDE